MKKYQGIWFTMEREVKRDYVMADSDEGARQLIYGLYKDGNWPADCLSISPVQGGPVEFNMNGGTLL